MTDDLVAELRRRGVEDVDDSVLTRALYSSDASLYRVVPQVVARPRHPDELLAVLDASRTLGVPLTMRGAGTSIAGNAVGPGIVVDTARHLGRVLSVDPESRTAVVQPGAVHAVLQRAATRHGLRFGPDPSTHTRCTIGGMIGNNACGSRALGYGRTADNVAGLRVAFGTGEVVDTAGSTVSTRSLRDLLDQRQAGDLLDQRQTGDLLDQRQTGDLLDQRQAGDLVDQRQAGDLLDQRQAGDLVDQRQAGDLVDQRQAGDLVGQRGAGAGLAALVDDHLAHVRTSFGRFPRQVSGYSFEHLLPERGRRLDRFLVGSEGTLAVVLEATVELVAEERERRLLVLGYPSMAEAADAVPALLGVPGAGETARMVACEGLDARIVDLVRASGSALPGLPRGAGWLFVEVAGESTAELVPPLLAAAGALEHRLVSDPAEAAVLWRIREDGAGLAARSLGRPAYSGWEDAAVPPDRLGAWLREFDDLLAEHGLQGVPYGHFGDGCVHVRIDFAFDDGGRRFRDFLEAGATALRSHGGSLSGEHGDGRARSELLPLMYDEESLRLFAAAKAVCDPDGLLNPGVLTDPAPLDADLRPTRSRASIRNELRLVHDGGSLAAAVHRCTGVGKCVAPAPAGVMCPSHQATREEKDSTRGRARVLQEALDGSLVEGLDHPAVHDALDLCLACKGCASDCPTGVDMGTYKSEVLHQQYAGRRRPRGHYALGRLPQWLRLAGPAAGVANRLTTGPLGRVAKAAAGVDPRRSLPPIARRSLRAQVSPPEAADVWIWADTFTDRFLPGNALAATRLLEAAGLRVGVVPEPACCGLTWLATGQLDGARARMAGAVAALAPYVDGGVPVVGLEPSCLATMRTDAVQLLDDPRAERVAAGLLTLAELLARLDWQPPDLHGTTVVAQPHCHHASVLGWEADELLLRRAGAEVVRVRGCCGLAGSFGMEKGHYDVSVAIAETHLLPAVRTHPDAVVLADGLSCRHQLADLAGVPAMHLAELLASRIGG